MSAFIVEDQTINRIVTCLADLEHSNVEPFMSLTEHGARFNGSSGDERQARADRLAREMFTMNMMAVHFRYGKLDDMMPERAFEFAWEHSGDAWQVLKSLHCYLYQCSEGNVPDRPLYKELKEFGARLADALACSQPQYDAASWG